MTETVGRIVLEADARRIDSATKSLKDFESAGNGAEQSAAKLSSATTVLSNSVKILASAFAAFKLLDYAKEAAMLSARYDTLGTVMGTVGKNAGYTARQMEETAQALQKTGITMIGSREQVLKLVQSHIDLAHATKLARIAQDAAVIANVNSTEAFDRMLHGIRSGQTENLRTLGLNVTLENSYKKYAQALGVTTEALDQEQKVQAVLNAVMKEGETIAGAYEAAMGTASKMLASTERIIENLKVRLGSLFDDAVKMGVSSYTDLLKDLDKVVESMAASGELKDWARRIAIEFAFLLDITRVFIKQIDILFTMTAAGFSSIKSGDFSGLTKAFMNADEALKALYQDGTKYQDQVNKRIISESMLTDRVTGTSNSLQASSKALEKVNTALQTGTKRTKEYNVEVYKLKEIQQQLANAREIEYQKLKRHESVLDEARSLTDSVKTAQERHNDTLKRYNELRPHISAETYVRALRNAEEELSRATTANTQFHDEWRSAWQNMEQTGRHAFTQFAAHGTSAMESIGQSLKLAVFDLLYQLTARKWIINIGTSLEGSLSGVFGGGGGKAGAASGGGLNIFAGGGMGQSITGMIGRAGSSLPGSVGTFFGGMGGTAATAARGATALWGTSGLTGAASMGAGVGSMMGAAAGPLLGAYISTQILKSLAGDLRVGGGFGKFINKIGDIPILGDFLPMIPLLNALFGRGPLKQKETTLSGAIGMEGFESGMLETRFKAKGGLFRSNKTDFTRIDAITGEVWTDNQKQLGEFAKEMGRASKEIFSAFNEAAKQSSKILTDTSKDLGLSTESLKDFNYQLKLVSEKGKGLTEEQIAEEIGKMSDAMAEKLIPNIADLAKTSETLIAAVGRLHAEFLAAENAVRILGGSLEASREYVRGMGFELRTAFMDAAGGAESFNQKMAFVSENFLTAEQRFAMSTETLNDQLNKLGVPLDITKEGFYQLLSSAGAAGDAIKFGGLLDIAPLFVEIADAAKATNDALDEQRILRIQEAFWRDEQNKFDQAGITFATLQRSIEAEKQQLTESHNNKLLEIERKRNDLTSAYNDAVKISEERITSVSDAVANLADLSKFLKSAITSLAPMGIEAARAQVRSAISTGDLSSPQLRDAITALSQPGTGFASKIEAQRYQSQNLQLLQSLDISTDSELLLQQRTLSALEDARIRLDEGFKDEIAALADQEKILNQGFADEIKRLDDILKGAQDQLNALNRIDNSVLSVAAALSAFSSAMQAASTAVRPNEVVTIDPSVAAAPVYGPSRYSSADILAFGQSHTPMETYQAAQQYGVTSAEIAASGLYTQAQINQFVQENKLASFDVGGKTRATGIAMLHKDEQVLTRGETTAMEQNLEEMKKAIEVLTITQNKMNRRFDKWDNEGLPDTRVA